MGAIQSTFESYWYEEPTKFHEYKGTKDLEDHRTSERERMELGHIMKFMKAHKKTFEGILTKYQQFVLQNKDPYETYKHPLNVPSRYEDRVKQYFKDNLDFLYSGFVSDVQVGQGQLELKIMPEL